MKKNFITKEYSVEPTAGTFNMKELRSFFSSKILEIEDTMTIDENDIIWNESIDHTQGLGVDNQNKSLDTFGLKSKNHTIRIYPNQSDTDKKEFTRWELNFNIREIFRQYMFAQLKKNRTFSGIANDKTKYNNIDLAIYEYIELNIIPRVKFFTINLYIKYYNVSDMQENGQIALQYNNVFREDIIKPTPLSGETTTQYINRSIQYKKDIKVTNYQLTVDASQVTASLIYKQIKSSANTKFDYYFDVVFVKA